ncbi:hypothetical protein BGZ83_010697 [Gryganskiella cystojenkinii]|nr:hypothetical protein BGZ83_010697 [Gryganskiella cystojenkinii]
MKSFRVILYVIATLAIAAAATPQPTLQETGAVEASAINNPSDVHKPSGIHNPAGVHGPSGVDKVRNISDGIPGLYSPGIFISYSANPLLKNLKLATYLHDEAYNVLQRFLNNHIQNSIYSYYELPFRTPKAYGPQLDLWMSIQVYSNVYFDIPSDVSSAALTKTVNMAVFQGTFGYTQIVNGSRLLVGLTSQATPCIRRRDIAYGIY